MHSSTGHNHIPGCWAVARSGIPAREPLFNGTICRHPGRWGQLAYSRGFTFGNDGGAEHLEVHSNFCLRMSTRPTSVREESVRQIIAGSCCMHVKYDGCMRESI